MSATARLEVRVRPEVKARIEHAAELAQMPVSDFVRSAAEDRAERVLAEHQIQTRVPPEFFDALLDALDAEPRPNPALARPPTAPAPCCSGARLPQPALHPRAPRH